MFQVPTLNKNKNTRSFNSVSQVALQCMLSDWAHVQGSSVVQREQHEYDIQKKHQEPQPCLPKYLCGVWSVKVECFAKIVNGFHMLTVFTKCSMLNI